MSDDQKNDLLSHLNEFIQSSDSNDLSDSTKEKHKNIN